MTRRFFIGFITQVGALVAVSIIGKKVNAGMSPTNENNSYAGYGSNRHNSYGYGFRHGYGGYHGYGNGYGHHGYGYTSPYDAYDTYGYGPSNDRKYFRQRTTPKNRGVSSDGALNIDFETLTNRKT